MQMPRTWARATRAMREHRDLRGRPRNHIIGVYGETNAQSVSSVPDGEEAKGRARGSGHSEATSPGMPVLTHRHGDALPNPKTCILLLGYGMLRLAGRSRGLVAEVTTIGVARTRSRSLREP